MGLFYASAIGTVVLQLKAIPERPAGLDAAEYNATPYNERGWVSQQGLTLCLRSYRCCAYTAATPTAVTRAASYPLHATLLSDWPSVRVPVETVHLREHNGHGVGRTGVRLRA